MSKYDANWGLTPKLIVVANAWRVAVICKKARLADMLDAWATTEAAEPEACVGLAIRLMAPL